ncbi:hypothetical protein NDU88_003305, partial [Pleurodeles waltl]
VSIAALEEQDGQELIPHAPNRRAQNQPEFGNPSGVNAQSGTATYLGLAAHLQGEEDSQPLLPQQVPTERSHLTIIDFFISVSKKG